MQVLKYASAFDTHFTDDTLKCIILKKYILLQISLTSFFMGVHLKNHYSYRLCLFGVVCCRIVSELNMAFATLRQAPGMC